jgi:hypothetical protein
MYYLFISTQHIQEITAGTTSRNILGEGGIFEKDVMSM